MQINQAINGLISSKN